MKDYETFFTSEGLVKICLQWLNLQEVPTSLF